TTARFDSVCRAASCQAWRNWRCLVLMRAHEFAEPRSAVSRAEGLLTWLGGGHWRELGERHERSTHAVAGAVVLCGAVLAWVVAALAVTESARGPMWGIIASTVVFGLLVAGGRRGTGRGPRRGAGGATGHGGGPGTRSSRRCTRRRRW